VLSYSRHLVSVGYRSNVVTSNVVTVTSYIFRSVKIMRQVTFIK